MPVIDPSHNVGGQVYSVFHSLYSTTGWGGDFYGNYMVGAMVGGRQCWTSVSSELLVEHRRLAAVQLFDVALVGLNFVGELQDVHTAFEKFRSETVPSASRLGVGCEVGAW